MVRLLSVLLNKFRSDTNNLLSQILADNANREELLGMKAPIIPTPDGVRVDAAKILKYTDSEGYKKFANEAWGQIIQSLDIILDDKASDDKVKFHRGVVKATLDLLRLSYKAKEVVKAYREAEPASLRPVSK